MGEHPPQWAALLADAARRPGIISDAYRRFWTYSFGNQLLAYFQCLARNIEPGPINTFLGWKACGRTVRKGEKALTLCMPVTVKQRRRRRRRKADAAATNADPADDVTPAQGTHTRFVFRRHWFVLAQTEGDPYVPPEIPAWDAAVALRTLGIDRVPFTHPDGNVQGYATERAVAVSPIAFLPHRTLFHETAHVVLGHTAEGQGFEDHERTPRNVREVEAEAVALLCSESLGLPGAEYSRGYLQHWLGSATIPERSAQRIFRAADQILRAGRGSRETT